MATTPFTAARIPADLVDAARARVGSDVSVSVLLRAGLAVLAGSPLPEALTIAELPRSGRPRLSGDRQ